MHTGVRGHWLLCSVVVIVSAVAALSFEGLGPEFPLDDAYIHLAYAKSLRLAEGFSYNPHDWELGATSPLWVAVLALLPHGEQIVPWTKVLGSLLHGVGVALSVLVALALARLHSDPAGSLAPRQQLLVASTAAVFVGLHPLLLQGATSGMEVPLTVALLAGTTLALISGRFRTASVLAALAVWARPESLVFVCGLCTLLCLGPERRRAWLPMAAAGAAMAAWVLYCLACQGQPLPNTFYAKTYETQPLVGLGYLVTKVLALEAWLVAGAGALVIALHLRGEPGAPRRWTVLLALSWFATLIAISISRYLNPAILFYMQRYFAIVAFVPPVLLAASVVRRRRAVLWLAPCLAVLAYLLPITRARIHAQEQSVRSQVARWVSARLPSDSVLLVEYAGAMRYFTPRTMHVVDMLGLNTSGVAMALRSKLYLCTLASYRPGYLVLPSELLNKASGIFQGDVLKIFSDRFAQVEQPVERKVLVIRVTGLHADAVARCQERVRASSAAAPP